MLLIPLILIDRIQIHYTHTHRDSEHISKNRCQYILIHILR